MMDDFGWNYSYSRCGLVSDSSITNEIGQSQKSFTKLTMVATIHMGWVPLVMVISISNTEELYYSTNRTTMVATIVFTIVPIEVGRFCRRGPVVSQYAAVQVYAIQVSLSCSRRLSLGSDPQGPIGLPVSEHSILLMSSLKVDLTMTLYAISTPRHRALDTTTSVSSCCLYFFFFFFFFF